MIIKCQKNYNTERERLCVCVCVRESVEGGGVKYKVKKQKKCIMDKSAVGPLFWKCQKNLLSVLELNIDHWSTNPTITEIYFYLNAITLAFVGNTKYQKIKGNGVFLVMQQIVFQKFLEFWEIQGIRSLSVILHTYRVNDSAKIRLR